MSGLTAVVKHETASNGLVVNEQNQKRKFHRVELPLQVEFNGFIYPIKDWSVGGLRIEALKDEINTGDILSINIVLPMHETKVFIACEVRSVHLEDESFGFEFHNPSARLKRILRHYVDMAVEGRLTHVDDIIAITTAPVVESPIEDALIHSEEDQKHVNKAFKKRGFWTLFFGLILFGIIASSIAYKTVYRIQKVGVVSGTVTKISSNVKGVVTDVLVSAGDFVSAGTPLYHLDTSEIDDQIASTTTLISHLEVMVSEEAGETNEEDEVLSKRKHELALLKLKLQRLNQKKSELIIKSPVYGVVVNVDHHVGDLFNPQDVVALVEKDITPYISLRMPSDEAFNLNMGMTAKIYVPSLNTYFFGKISAIGFTAFDVDVSAAKEAMLGETLVKIEFDDQKILIPSNSRVKVWIQSSII